MSSAAAQMLPGADESKLRQSPRRAAIGPAGLALQQELTAFDDDNRRNGIGPANNAIHRAPAPGSGEHRILKDGPTQTN